LVRAEEAAIPKAESGSKSGDTAGSADNTLLNTNDELYLRGKSSFVLWMLRDMLGDTAMQAALAKYHPGADKDPSYLQKLLQTSSKRDLEWFFDDWVYRDRGLPDFKVASEFTRKTLPEGYMLTVTVDNLGPAGAEVPLTVKFASGEITKRLVVHGKSNGVIRIEVPKPPEEIVVNDGSVPESDTTNNTFEIKVSDAVK
jgi:hypothetical protein